jgi:hypothetical protein
MNLPASGYLADWPKCRGVVADPALVDLLVEWESRLRKARAYLIGFFAAFADSDAIELVADFLELDFATVESLHQDLGFRRDPADRRVASADPAGEDPW